ncbi:hypothetical protein Tco_0588318 [Tanacetum coccineum]
MEGVNRMITDQIDGTNPEGDSSQSPIVSYQLLPTRVAPLWSLLNIIASINKDLEYLRYGSKGSNPALSISKMKDASYPGFEVELLVPEQMWIDDVCTYEISAKYGISHWWFNRQKFYINRHDSSSRRKDLTLKTESILLLMVISIIFPDSDKDAIYCCQAMDPKLGDSTRVEDFQLGIESYQTQLNLTKPGWDATGYEFKHLNLPSFYVILEYSVMDVDTLFGALDYRVKEFKVKRLNPGMNTQFWTQKDVTRSKEFIAAIERRLKTRRIFWNLECFVGGRVRDIDYRLLQRTE